MPFEAADGGCRVRLWVQPRAARDGVVGIQGDAVKVRLTAPPVEGKANAALLRFLARQLGVSRGAVKLTAGAGSRRKTVQIAGLGVEEVRARLGV